MRCDLTDRTAVSRAVDEIRPSIVYHLAGAARVERAWSASAESLEANVMGTHYLLDALRRSGVNVRILIPSSAMVYAAALLPLTEDSPVGPDSPYGFSKLAQERLGVRAVATDGQDIVIARAFNHVGPRQAPSFALAGFAKQIAEIEAGLAPPVIKVGNLQATRDITDVRDTVRAYRDLVSRARAGRIYNVCSGIGAVMGALLQELVERARIDVHVEVDAERLRPIDTPVLVGDASRIHDETGWEPQIPLGRTLDDLLAYWRSVVGPTDG
jgi:GDP-4-dehydro-6-deoxy-D-mannose reductase